MPGEPVDLPHARLAHLGVVGRHLRDGREQRPARSVVAELLDVDRRQREILPAVRDQRLGLLVYSPLAGGFLSGKFRRGAERDQSTRWGRASNPPVDESRGYDVVDRLDEIAGRHGATVAQVALAWAMQQPGVSSVLVGATRMDQLQNNLAAAALTLAEDDLAALDEVSRLAPEYVERVQSGPGARQEPVG
ncbi:aldo/keto reductase [Streptomyces sp. ME19-03-3]|nr:aldo/keto reductase [Streptomyces sp. ME19-03-3]